MMKMMMMIIIIVMMTRKQTIMMRELCYSLMVMILLMVTNAIAECRVVRLLGMQEPQNCESIHPIQAAVFAIKRLYFLLPS